GKPCREQMQPWTARCFPAEPQLQERSQSYATCRFPFGCIWMNIFRVGAVATEVVFSNTVCSREIAGDWRKLPGSSRVPYRPARRIIGRRAISVGPLLDHNHPCEVTRIRRIQSPTQESTR